MSTYDWDQVFDEDYLFFYEAFLTPERNDREAESIAGLLGLPPGTAVLDVPCGHGRIANRLARRGYRVAGLDRSPLFLERARDEARAWGVEVDYREGDMRALPWPDGTFDAVVCWFTSFGYFNDEDNRRVLAEFHRVLRPGGRLLLEQIHRERVVRSIAPGQPETVAVVERDGHLLIDRSRFDLAASRVETERILVRDGRVRRVRYGVRLYTLTELDGLLREQGFREVQAWGELGDRLTLDSRRLVTLAVK